MGERLLDIWRAAGVPLILKASFDKANRTSHTSYRGPGLEEGLRVLGRVKAKLGVPILSDVHESAQVEAAAEVLDVLQLVVDMRGLVIMRGLGFPVVFDGAHSVQLPGGAGTRSSGEREFIAPLVRAAVAAGCDGVFLEVHPDPDRAPSDGPNMLPLDSLPSLLTEVTAFQRVLRHPV